MAKEKKTMASVIDDVTREAIIGGMAGSFAAGASRRLSRADSHSADSAALWTIAMTSPTVNAAAGYRMMAESGSNQTRVDTNESGNA